MGPLHGVRVLEMAGIGPAPYCCMVLADMGAEVLRVDRLAPADLGVPLEAKYDMMNRNKLSAAIDLKSPEGNAAVLELVRRADILIEGFRPGVMERLGLGPELCFKVKPVLIYGRLTGWGQDGPLADTAGHDLNYLALSGGLHAFGRKDGPPAWPLNLVGDFAGGALFLGMGVLAALLEARASGKGQVVDATMIDGVANLMTMFYGFKQMGIWQTERGVNFIDSGSHFYDVYETSDGKYVTVAAVEKRFYAELLERLGLAAETLPKQNDPKGWDGLRARFATIFKQKTRDEWCVVFEGSDACFAPVLDMDECVTHPHNAARGVFQTFDGLVTPSPAPRFSRTPSTLRTGPTEPGADTDRALGDWGFSSAQIAALKAAKTIR